MLIAVGSSMASLWAQEVPGELLSTATNSTTQTDTPAPTEVVTQVVPAELLAVQAQLAERDERIAKLSRHLDSALQRLNWVQKSGSELSPTLAGLTAARANLEAQNNILKAKQEQLNAQVAELTRQKQLLDLENRQLFQALNGRSSIENEIRAAQKNSPGAQRRLVFE